MYSNCFRAFVMRTGLEGLLLLPFGTAPAGAELESRECWCYSPLTRVYWVHCEQIILLRQVKPETGPTMQKYLTITGFNFQKGYKR